MRLRNFSPLVLCLALGACSDTLPTDPAAGTEMSVGDQIAIEAAMGKFADTLEARGGTRQDTLLADLARVVGRIARLNGREGFLTVTVPGSSVPVEMRAVALYSSDAASQDPEAQPHLNVVVAWEGLDNGAMTFRRAVIVGVDGPAPEGSYSVSATSATDAARFVDFSTAAPAHFYFNVAGSLTVAGQRFRGLCVGLPPTGPFSCRSGRESVGAALTVSRDNGQTAPALSWPAAELPTYSVTAG